MTPARPRQCTRKDNRVAPPDLDALGAVSPMTCRVRQFLKLGIGEAKTSRDLQKNSAGTASFCGSSTFDDGLGRTPFADPARKGHVAGLGCVQENGLPCSGSLPDYGAPA